MSGLASWPGYPQLLFKHLRGLCAGYAHGLPGGPALQKILFSSDAPFGDMCQEIDKVKSIADNQADLELMLGKNAAAMLGIDYH